MSWRTLTETDLLQALSGSELDALRAAVLASGQADPIATQIAQVVDMVRGYIRGGGFDLGEADTIPESLISPAVDLIVLRVGSRAAGFLLDDNNVRRDAARAAQSLFRDVANGKFRVESPTDKADAAEQGQVTAPSMTTPTTYFDRSSQEGI